MKLVDFSTSRRVTVAMIMVAVVAFGSVGFSRLSLNLLPDITYPTITVRTEYAGTAPAEMERLITEPVEGVVGVVSNVVRVSSISRPGLSDVIIEFGWGTEMDFAALDVREKLDLLNLPQDASKPVLLRFDPSLDPVMRIALYGGNSLMELRRVAEERIRLDLESLEGVAAVRVEGGLEEEIHVEVETSRLASLGISISQVTQRLAAENVNLTGGLLKDGEAEFLVRTLNEFTDPASMEDLVVAEVGGAALRLADVGRVVRGHRERDVVTRINGREGVEIAIFKEGDANTVAVSETVKQRLESFSERYADLLGDAEVDLVVDQAVFIEQSVSEVLSTALIGGVLAIIVLFLFLRDLKSTVIIGLSIPISVVATFFLMYSTDVSLNIMSLGGLALGIGMLVDSSIVVLENVQRYRDDGVDTLGAARRGTSEVAQAVIAATMTTICVFVPIVFVEGVAGQLFRDQALTVTYSLVAALFVALMLLPMLSSIALRPLSREEEGDPAARRVRYLAGVLAWVARLFALIGRSLLVVLTPALWLFDRLYGVTAEAYPRLLRWSLGHRLVTLAVFILLGAGVLLQARSLGVELIPEMSQGEFLVDLEWPAGTPLEATATQVAHIDEQLRNLAGIQTAFSLVGASGETGGYADEKKENLAQVFIRLRQEERQAEESVMSSVRQVLAQIPDLDYKFSRPSYFSFRTPIEVEVTGYSLQTLQDLSTRVADQMRRMPGLVDVRSSAEGGQPEIQVIFDRQRVAELGTTIQAIGDVLRNKLQGEVSTELIRQDRRIDVRVRAVEDERESVADLRRMIISPVSYPVPIPLEAVADVIVVEGPAEIRRLDQERAVLITANLSGRDLGSAVAEIEASTAGLALPDGFGIQVGGQNEEMVRSFASMKFALTLAIFLVYLVMASQFESLLHPLVIMFTIPLGLIGSVLALLVTGQTISVVVLIGLIMLAGIVVNNAIVLVDYINQLRRRDNGLPKIEAVLEAGRLRFRPILMTTATTILALLPMALGLGEGAEIRAPMAITVIGGLLVSTILTLVVIPVVYTSLDRAN